MSVEVWLAFVAALVILLIIPGPTILTVISYSVAHDRRANVPLVTAAPGSHCGTMLPTSLIAVSPPIEHGPSRSAVIYHQESVRCAE